jgi:ribonuclease HII
MLKTAYCTENGDEVREIGVDEAGRGPMLGRVYAAAVILPADLTLFNHALMKDSKKFHSEKKIRAAAAYIKEKAIAWAVAFSSEKVIDEFNIRNATHKAMHKAIDFIHGTGNNVAEEGVECVGSRAESAESAALAMLLLVDGNDFTPYVAANTTKRLQHVCIEGGDNAFSCIAAASILAKVARDDYVADLCTAEPNLIERYDLLKNKGYGTKKHMDGIRQYGISPYHRKTFGLCKEFA